MQFVNCIRGRIAIRYSHCLQLIRRQLARRLPWASHRFGPTEKYPKQKGLDVPRKVALRSKRFCWEFPVQNCQLALGHSSKSVPATGSDKCDRTSALAAATAQLAPLPPPKICIGPPMRLFPGTKGLSHLMVRSALYEPMTTTLGLVELSCFIYPMMLRK
jgi:hypothetical protein